MLKVLVVRLPSCKMMGLLIVPKDSTRSRSCKSPNCNARRNCWKRQNAPFQMARWTV